MASSGSLKSSTYEGRGVIFEWSLAGQSIADNTSTISWTLKGYGTASAGWYYCGPVNLTINGTKVVNNLNASPNRVQLRDGTLIASGSTSIPHNADGTKTFNAALDASIYLATQNCTGSASFTLDTIPRASSFGDITGSTIGSALRAAPKRPSIPTRERAVPGRRPWRRWAPGSQTPRPEAAHSIWRPITVPPR